MNGTALREGHHIVISWHGGDLMQATVLEVITKDRLGWTATLVLRLPDGRRYRRRHVIKEQVLILR